MLLAAVVARSVSEVYPVSGSMFCIIEFESIDERSIEDSRSEKSARVMLKAKELKTSAMLAVFKSIYAGEKEA